MIEHLTKEVFEEEWYKLVRTGLGHMKAYDILEEWHYDRYGSFRYSTYYSFANIRDGRNRKK